MIIKKWSARLKCNLFYVRLYDQNGKRKLFGPGHTSKTVAKDYEKKLEGEIREKKAFPERFVKERAFNEFVQEYLEKHAENIKSY